MSFVFAFVFLSSGSSCRRSAWWSIQRPTTSAWWSASAAEPLVLISAQGARGGFWCRLKVLLRESHEGGPLVIQFLEANWAGWLTFCSILDNVGGWHFENRTVGKWSEHVWFFGLIFWMVMVWKNMATSLSGLFFWHTITGQNSAGDQLPEILHRLASGFYSRPSTSWRWIGGGVVGNCACRYLQS